MSELTSKPHSTFYCAGCDKSTDGVFEQSAQGFFPPRDWFICFDAGNIVRIACSRDCAARVLPGAPINDSNALDTFEASLKRLLTDTFAAPPIDIPIDVKGKN